MNKRLEQFLAAENISQSQFADIIGVTRANVSHILAGRNKPGFDFIYATMTHFPALNIDWLLAGQGKMYKSPSRDVDSPANPGPIQPSDESPTESVPLFSDISNTAQEKSEEHIDTLEDNKETTTITAVPIEEPVKAVPEPEKRQRRISRIVVMYDDGSFEEIG